MKKLYPGFLYLISSPCWFNYKKVGVSNNIEKRVNNIKTYIPSNIAIECKSDKLIDKYFFENRFSKEYKNYRLYNKKEFYDISNDDFMIYLEIIHEINKKHNNNNLLLEYIKSVDYKYYKSRFS